jgi:protein SCO1/2
MSRSSVLRGSLILCCLVAALIYSRATVRAGEVELPKYGQLGNFEFVSSTAEKLELKKYAGKVLLINFFFTSCQGICPNIMGKMARIHQNYGANQDLQMLSFTVDPETDQLEQLVAYQKKLKVESEHNQTWLFARSNQAELLEFIKNGAKLVGDQDPNRHSTRVVLVDQQGIVRGYYDGLIPDLVDQLSPALDQLLGD